MYLKNFLIGVVAASTALSFAACSNDDDNDDAPSSGPSQNITQVFPNGQISSITTEDSWGGKETLISDIVRDKNGRVISMKYDGEPYEISYVSSNAVKVTTYEDGNPWVRTFSLGKNGYISGFEQREGSYVFRISLEYDNEARLVKRTDNEYDGSGSSSTTTTITYNSAGDITKVEIQSQDKYDGYEDESSLLVSTVEYTNSTITTPIENKGGVMFYDEFFDIDLDEDICLYYAGLLGKATAHLPLSIKQKDEYVYGGNKETYEGTLSLNWSLLDNGVVSSLNLTDQYGSEFYYFTWK